MDSIILRNRTKSFAHRCVKLATSLPKGILERHLAGQLIRSSTSVAANYRACCVAQRKKSFTAKISIAYEEADESYFWIEFIVDEKIIPPDRIIPLLKEADEITRILAASRKTSASKKSTKDKS
jgi:four helix bundle protein